VNLRQGELKVKITKRQLRRIIKEEKMKVEGCGDTSDTHVTAIDAAPTIASVVDTVNESQSPEGELVMEMEMASRNLELALESINAAAGLCPSCVHEVAAAAPLMEALESQAGALQETLNAVGIVIAESVGLEALGGNENETVANIEFEAMDY